MPPASRSLYFQLTQDHRENLLDRANIKYLGTLISLTVVCLGFIYGNLLAATVNLKPYKYNADNCEFSIVFPNKPTIDIYTYPGYGDVQDAVWKKISPDESIGLASECLNIPNLTGYIGSNTKDFLLTQLEFYAKENGLSSTSFRVKQNKIGYYGILRGNKTAQGVPATYKILMVIGKKSIITLKASGTSATFPQKVIQPFLDSVRLVNP